MSEPKIILVVEDDHAMRQMIGVMLEFGGYAPLLAGCGREALRLARARNGQIALAIVDVVLPELGGREVGWRLSDMEPAPKLLYISAMAPAKEATSTFGLHGAPYLEKPFVYEDLLGAVRAVLSGGGNSPMVALANS